MSVAEGNSGYDCARSVIEAILGYGKCTTDIEFSSIEIASSSGKLPHVGALKVLQDAGLSPFGHLAIGPQDDSFHETCIG
jgi:hypothetical protein